MLNLIIHGCAGKMGRNMAVAALESPGEYTVVAGVDKFLSGTFDFPTYKTIWEAKENADAIIDFTRPDGLCDLLAWARQTKTAAVIATTGLEAAHHALLAEAGRDIPVLLAANLSIGVNLLQDLVQQSAAFLRGFNIEIVETHHNQKVDAPSGTALALAEAARRGLAAPHDFVYGRHGVNRKRTENEIGIHALRGGTVVGEHNVYFFGNDETVTLSHTSQARLMLARGGLRAAAFLKGRAPGLYTMRDVIMADEVVTALHIDREQARVAVSGVPGGFGNVAAVFSAVAHINIDMISQNLTGDGLIDLSFTCGRGDAASAKEAVENVAGSWPGVTVEPDTDAVKLTLEGRGMPQYAGVAARAFEALPGGIVVKSITTSETKISCLIAPDDLPGAEKAWRAAFEL